MNQQKRTVRKNQNEEEGWEPTAPEADLSKKEGRSLDVGESGQFAPGGYFNQQAPGHSRLDELVPDENIEESVKKKK